MADKFVWLCFVGDLEGVQAALQSGTDVNSKDEPHGKTGLMMALEGKHVHCSGKHTAVIRLLLEQEGIDINICDNYGQTALHWAAKFAKNSKCIAILLAHPELTSQTVNKKNIWGYTPLLSAVWGGGAGCVQVLINDARTDLNIKNDYGESPLMFAVKRNYVGCAALLLPHPRVDLMTRDAYERSGEEVKR